MKCQKCGQEFEGNFCPQCGADWNEQAAKSAASYLERMSFSRSERIEQLVFDGFTQEQAEYGAAQNGD